MRAVYAGVMVAGIALEGSAEAQIGISDSAGVRIVQLGDPMAAPLAFLVDTQPRVRLGGQNADLNYEIVRAQSAALLANGHIAVAMLQDANVRVFDERGTFLGTVGRRGRGPGEMSQATSVTRGPNNGLLVFDQLLRRSTEFSAVGAFVRLMPSPTAVLCCAGDGSFLAVAYRRQSTQPLTERGTWAAIRVSGDSSPVIHDTLAFFAGSDPMLTYSAGSTSGASGAVASARLALPAPFGRISSMLPYGDGFLTGDGEHFDLREHDRNGRVTRIIRAAAVPLQISSALQRRYESDALRGVTGARRSSELAAMRAYRYPATAPVVRKMLTDLERRIWVEMYPLPGAVKTTWVVISPSGALLGRVETAVDQNVVSIGRNELLTLKRNAAEGTMMVSVLPFRPPA
jgi:hypothetical protein